MATPAPHYEKSSAAAPHTADLASSTVSLDKDDAAAIVGEHAQNIDPVLEARVLRKIDLFLIPAMIVGYGLVYYDK
ncbi:hypothetical protein LTR28_010765, partial [Elasticomyces elasticus]